MSDIVNDIISQLLTDNRRQADEMLKAARDKLGLAPTGQFITQETTSNLLSDKTWVEQRGGASESKKRRISGEISSHSKQRTGLLGSQTAKEIANIRELYKDDAARMSEEESKLKRQAKEAGAQIKAKEADALKAVEELRTVSESRDNYAVSRANEYAKIELEVEKFSQRFQSEIEQLGKEMSSGSKVDKKIEDLRKRMNAAYQVKAPAVTAKQRQAQYTPLVDMSELAQTNVGLALDAFVEQSRKQVRLRALTSKVVNGKKTTPAQWKKGRYAFDTETTGVEDEDMPVTFGLGGYTEAGEKVIKDFFLSYGDRKKTSAKIIKAANVRDMNNQLIESAVQLRNRLGIAGSSDITSIDSDTWNKLVKPNLITPTQLVKELDSLGITSQTASDKLYSFNGKSFDIPMIDKWVSQYAKTTKTSGVAGSKLQDILSKSVNNDIFQVLKEAFIYKENHGSISKGDNILQADSTNAKSRIKGSSTLLRFFSIVSGQKSAGAHGAGDDAASTIEVASWAMTTELFEGVASELEGRIAAQGDNYKNGGYFTNQYKGTINQALDLMVGVMDEQAPTGNQLVKPNQVLVDKFRKLSKDVSNIATGSVSVDSIKQQIVSEYAKVGIGVKFEGNRVGLYPLKDFATPEEASWDKIASVEMAVLDGSGSLRRGEQAVANIAYPSHVFLGEGKRPTPVLYSSNEAQYMHLLKQLGSNPQEKETKLVQAIKSGDTQYASRIMNIGVRDALSGVPTATTSTVRDEAVEEVHGMKNPEQMAAITGLFSTSDLADFVLRQKKDGSYLVQQIYDLLYEQGSLNFKRTFDPNNLTQDEYAAVNTAYALVAQGYDLNSTFQGDSLTKRLTLSPEFRQFQEEVRMFASLGLMPSVESLKEESVLSGFLTTSGAHDILPLNVFGDASNRALNQVFNYNKRAFAPQLGTSMKFSSEVGRALGVDYDKAEMTQYTGATTDDSALLKALQELGLSLKYANTSVEEGGMVIPLRMANELASYRAETTKAYDQDIDPFFISKTLGITTNSLSELGVGETIRFNEGVGITIGENDEKTFSKNLTLAQGDVVIGLKKLADGFELITKRFETTKQGTKLLTEGGGRLTARVLPDDVFDLLTQKMGITGKVDFLTEKKSMESRNMMPQLRGRLSYMIQEAFNQNPDINMELILKVLRETTQIGKSFSIGADGKLQSSAFYDVKNKAYKYYDDAGKVLDLFVPQDGESIDSVIRKAFVESSLNSDFSNFGRALLGANYDNTFYNKSIIGADGKVSGTERIGYTAQFVNMANEVPYYNPIGSGNADILESRGRVKVADRERRAAARTFSNAEAILIKDGIEEGLRLFMQDELRLMEQYGQKGKQALTQIEGLEASIAATRPENGNIKGGYTNARGNYVELVYGQLGTLGLNLIDIKGMTAGFDYGEDGSGMTEEQYQNTIMGMARQKASELTKATGINYQDIVLNYNGTKYLLSDIVARKLPNEKYMPSATDRANDSIFRALSLESAEIAQEAINQVFSKKGEYNRIAHDKDSSVFRAANESFLGNSSYSKVVGRNMAFTAMESEKNNVNNIGVSREQLTGMLRSSSGSTNTDRAKNIRNLSYLLRSSGALVKDYTDVEKTASMPLKQLIEIENKIIDNIMARMLSGDMSLLSQVHRYPSTSGLDIRYGNLTLDDSLSGDAMSISRGLALTVNADYDGDKMWQRVLFANSDFDNYEDFLKALLAAQRIALLDSLVSNLMQQWDSEKKARPESSKENAYVKDLSKRGPNWLAAIMSKTNKLYVGQFSNVSTNVRNFMQDFGMDEIALSGTRSAGLSSIVRAYLESLEQDSISAKKVFGRLSSEKGESAAIDELAGLYKNLTQGNFEEATRQSEAMNLGFADSRLLQFVKATMQTYQPELYEKEFKDIFESGDTTKIMELVREGFRLVLDTASAKGLKVNDVVYKTNDRLTTLDRMKAERRVQSSSDSDAQETASAVSETKKKAEEMLREAQKAVSAFKSGRAKDKDGRAYSENHYRLVDFDGRRLEDENVLSVTGLLGQYDKDVPAWEKEKMEIAAAKGTYAHKVAEVLGRNLTYNIEDIKNDDAAITELLQAQIELEKALGFDATPELIQSLINRALNLVKVAQKQGLVGPNAEQEVTLGGMFDNGELQKAIAGLADVISASNEGITVGDYKFSSQGGPAIEAKRILLASIYLALYEEELLSELDKLNKQVLDGDTSDETQSKIKAIQGKLNASNASRRVKILRSFEQNGQVFTEIVTADAIEKQKTLEMLANMQTKNELEAKLAEIESRIKNGTSTSKDADEQARIKERLGAIGSISVSEILRSATNLERSLIDSLGAEVESNQGRPVKPKNQTKTINSYISNYKQQQRIQEQIQVAEQGMLGKTGEGLIAQLSYLRALQQQLTLLQLLAPTLDLINGTLNGEKLTEEQILDIQKRQVLADKEHLSRQAKITAGAKQQQSFLTKLVGGLKNQMTMFIDTSLAYLLIGLVRSTIRTLINTTKELDSALVDILIATGNTREETRALLLTYVDLAKEMGRTTQSVALASNDWLRAGYEGLEAAELTRASMMLSTLGMIEASEATTYLISTLKGWKISADEVVGVVDKLTVIICGVCLATSIGHGFKCR